MTIAKKFLASVLLASTSLASGLAMAEYAAVAYGTGGGNWAFSKTQADADWEALKKCNEVTPEKDCKVSVTKAVVKAVNTKNGYVGYGVHHTSLEAAKEQALKVCAGDRASCKVELVMTTPGFWTVAASEAKDGVRHYGLTYGYSNMKTSQTDAVAQCGKGSTLPCAVVWSGAVPGEVKP